MIDTGATETVGSLEAVEQIMKTRFAVFGQERIGLDVNKNNRFKFGNAQERSAECYLLLPQVIKGQSTQLGVYTLDVPGVPILLGVAKPSLISTKHFPGIEISYFVVPMVTSYLTFVKIGFSINELIAQ